MRNASWVLLLMFLLIGCGPMDQTPGLRLGGTPAPTPTDGFAFVQNGPEEILLEAWGTIFPRVVTIWGVGTNEWAYVWGDPNSGWVTRAAQRPDVRIRVGDSSYELRATTVTDPEEFETVVDLYNQKYGPQLKEMFEGRVPVAEDFGYFIRLSPRD